MPYVIIEMNGGLYMNRNYFFTSESVTEGHPDKLCDYISDSLLDEYLKQDKNSRVAIETFATKNKIIVSGEVTSTANINIESIVRNAIKEIGYGSELLDINPDTCDIEIYIVKQSPDIALGVDTGGAGDQGIMFGYATNETENYMPFAINMAHKLSKRLSEVRKNNTLPYLRPDGKTQVTVQYIDGIPSRIENILISSQYEDGTDIYKMRNDIIENVIYSVIPKKYIDENTKIHINPTGKFIIGGPLGDTGLTGRKIIVDTYGGYARHGGGAFSGKDCTKVDRSAAYMMRHIAKNVVANGFADKCELQVSYAIGMKEPLSVFIDTFGTNKISEDEILNKIKNKFDLTPLGIINYLNLRTPIYKSTTNYGHFGKEFLSWEKIINLE